MQKYTYVDVHCHPNLGELKENQNNVIEEMRVNGTLGIVVGVDLESSREAARLAGEHEHLFACVGLHPNYAHEKEFDTEVFSQLLDMPKVVGLGECGIDYFRSPEHKEAQWELFKKQVALAIEKDKPLMIHCRPSKNSMDAYEEVADYFESLGQHLDIDQKGELRGNMHFFVGNLPVARRFWSLGFTTSFTGVLTFTHDYDKVVKEAPLDMILTETDAPYAAPVPHRGEVNQPIYVSYVTEAIAHLKNLPVEEAQEAVLNNAKRLFSLY